MIPGLPGGRGDPRQAKKMMRQLGYKEWEGVEEVIIRMADRELVIRSPGVAEMTAQGQQMFMITGKAEEAVPGGGPAIPDEDVQLVAERAGVTLEEARQALIEADGEPAEAIIKLMQR
ncbi:MAG: nascent polypeptide-associated complex protein [Thermoplasmata archaeon]|jgi:nascent polypeptide-associated complex subunit alpha